MDATWIIAAFVVIDTVMDGLDHRSDVRADVPDAEIITIAVVAAKYFGNHHERAVQVMNGMGYLSGRISVSRFNRRRHDLADWLAFIPATLGALFTSGEVLVSDSLPLPVCRRVRASRCRNVRGRISCGYCAAKREQFFGWRLHLVCRSDGVPVRFQLLHASLHDLAPVHELAYDLPVGARLLGDQAYNSAADEARMLADTGVRRVPIRRGNMRPHAWFVDDIELRDVHHTIETRTSQREKMGVERLHARTHRGFELNVQASLVALICSTMN